MKHAVMFLHVSENLSTIVLQGQPHQESRDQHLLRRRQARSDEPIIHEGGVAERAGDDC